MYHTVHTKVNIDRPHLPRSTFVRPISSKPAVRVTSSKWCRIKDKHRSRRFYGFYSIYTIKTWVLYNIYDENMGFIQYIR